MKMDVKYWVGIALCVLIVAACALYAYMMIYGDEELQAAKIKTEAAKQEAQEVVREYRTTVIEHDIRIKEAGRNAVTKVDAYSDDFVLNAFDELITGARKRNAQRRCAVSADK